MWHETCKGQWSLTASEGSFCAWALKVRLKQKMSRFVSRLPQMPAQIVNTNKVLYRISLKMLYAIQTVIHLFNYLTVVGSSVAFCPIIINIHNSLPIFCEGCGKRDYEWRAWGLNRPRSLKDPFVSQQKPEFKILRLDASATIKEEIARVTGN